MKIPETGGTLGVDHRYVQEGAGACPGFQNRMPLPQPWDRASAGMASLDYQLLGGEARALPGNSAPVTGEGLELLAGLARGLEVGAPLFGVGFEILARMALHEGKIQGPPRSAQNGHPYKLPTRGRISGNSMRRLKAFWRTTMSTQDWWLQLAKVAGPSGNCPRHPCRPTGCAG